MTPTFINPIKNNVYKFLSKNARASKKNGAENIRKLDLFDAELLKIKNAKSKDEKKLAQERFNKLLTINKDLRFGKGVRELSSILSTVFILALCAPILSQIILHPVMNMIFHDKKKAQ